MKTNNKQVTKKTIISIALAVCMVCPTLFVGSVSYAKTDKTTTIYNSVKSAYGAGFPLSNNNKIKTKRKNIFGNYSKILGVSAKYFSKYTAGQKSNSKEEYMCFICKATSSVNVSKIKKALQKFVVNEYKSNLNYHSDKGKKILKNAKVGSKGKYVYLFALDTSKNKKAIAAFKKCF